ncbi:diacylglycerol kinase family protein [Ramlibacter tataouinensis]|uniref:diacylglycerol/lipid kinase family protein n=1 Tax=Ramlibacter tataouinensis TaxID=94132 RepID=UPI0022F38A3A|nr:diacylglycerol kinase family protein [Ramlibacter tataouinensis]WBY02281.1 diacylglycerol kinase family protein [Ramlibacter tataouinensis]
MRAECTDPAPGPEAAGSQPELFILVNPGSGGHGPGDVRATLEAVFGAAGRRFRFVGLASPADLPHASEAAAEQARACGGALVAVGGDGTLNTVAQAAWRHECPLGVLPQGTFNLFGREHGIPQELEAAAHALLRARTEPVQVGEVNGRLFLVNASLGLYPQLLQDREAFKQQFGRHRWVAVMAGLKTLFEWRRQLTLEIELDGERTVLRTPTLFVGNNRLQLQRIGMEPAIADRVGEGRLAALIARPIGSGAMAWLMLKGAFGRLGDPEQIDSFAFRTLTVRVLGRRRVRVAADGEVGVLEAPLHFSVAARSLRLLLPRAEDRVPVA